MALHSRYDNLRFSYEFGGMSIPELCAEAGFIIRDVEAYARANGWEQHNIPDSASAEQIHKFYTTARRKLSITATKRAMSLYSRLTSIEDCLLEAVETTLRDATSATSSSSLPGNGGRTLDGLELTRLVKVVETLQTNNRIYAEAFGILAQNDPDRVADDEAPENGDDSSWTFEVVHVKQ